MRRVAGLKSLYRDALKVHQDEYMEIPSSMVREMIERLSDLETAVIDLRASLRTCQNTSNAAMEQYKDL